MRWIDGERPLAIGQSALRVAETSAKKMHRPEIDVCLLVGSQKPNAFVCGHAFIRKREFLDLAVAFSGLVQELPRFRWLLPFGNRCDQEIEHFVGSLECSFERTVHFLQLAQELL